MPTEWTPLTNYAGAHHVLGAGACFTHPGNGNQYFWDCTQIKDAHQNLNIYRMVAKTGAWEKVVSFEGTIGAELGFERGQCQIGQGGALIVATTMIPLGVPHVTETGFQGVRCRIAGVDDPWSFTTDPALVARIDALERAVAQQAQTIAQIETELGNIQTGAGLTPEDRSNLDWIAVLRAAINMA